MCSSFLSLSTSGRNVTVTSSSVLRLAPAPRLSKPSFSMATSAEKWPRVYPRAMGLFQQKLCSHKRGKYTPEEEDSGLRAAPLHHLRGCLLIVVEQLCSLILIVKMKEFKIFKRPYISGKMEAFVK